MPPPSKQPDISRRANALLWELKLARGRCGVGVMVTDRHLAEALRVPARVIVDLAGELIDAGHLVPASCDPKNPGRCLLAQGDDLTLAHKYLEWLHSHGVKVLKRRRRFRDALRAAAIGQLALPLEQPA